MKLRKGILLTAFTILAIAIMSTVTSVQAATSTSTAIVVTKDLNLKATGYKVNERALFKIYINGTEAKESFYCIKGGPGFGSGSSAMGTAIASTSYTNGTAINGVGNLRYPENIKSPYSAALPQNTTNYRNLMWVLDNIYVPAKDANDQERANADKQILLEAVEQYVADMTAQYGKIPTYENTSIMYDKLTENLEESDIFLVQQLAIWHYTNSDSYHNNTMPAFSIDSSANWATPFFPDKDEQDARIHACNALFDYLVNTPKQPEFTYDYTQTGDAIPVKLGETNPQIKTEGNRKIVGPYSIEKVSDVNYTLNYTLTDGDGNTVSDVIFTNANGTKVANTVKELVGKGNFYISIPSTTNTKNLNFHINGNFMATTITYWGETNTNNVTTGVAQPVVQIEKESKDFEDEKEVQEKAFDLALRKFITSINGVELTGEESRVPQITQEELTALYNKNAHGVDKTTASKIHRKDAKTVTTGDKVVYTIRVYNEGEIDGWATEVTDHLPEGLKFLPATESAINAAYGWTSTNGKDVTTNYLAGESHKLTAFDGTTLDYKDLQIECEVIATPGATSVSLKNVAEITGHKDINGNTGNNLTDRDSVPNSLTENQIKNYGEDPNYYQDDDDFEHLILEPLEKKDFDLALRKFITKINNKVLDGEDSREPVITPEELERLANKNATGIDKTSALKEHGKDAITVKTGDKVVYTIRVYNEGEVDGWATQVTDHLPSGLQFIPASESTINATYGWTNPTGDGKTIVTSYLAQENQKINAFDGTTLDYKDLQIECEVIATPGATAKTLKNVAEITGNKDEDGNTNVNLDRDSKPGSLTDDDIDNYGITSKQDDDDFEILKLAPSQEKVFDLSLRKFIIDVQNPTTGKSHVLSSREPVVDVTPLLEGKDTANYNHTKAPVGVSNGDIVTYTIRVYNEGEIDGYITEITDNLPPQLEFIIDDELNAKYGWTIKEGSNGRTVVTDITSPNTTHSASRDLIYANRVSGTDKVLLKAFSYEEGATLDYIDIQIRCRVKENIDLYQKITNIAEISGFTDSEGNEVVDRDSKEANTIIPKEETLPEYKDSEIESGIPYIPGQEDDDDFEKLVLQIFDLALRKFITGVTNGETTTDITERAPVFIKNGNEYSYEHTKEPVEVANGNTVIYTLRIFNEGNMAGYATKVKDDLPDGLEFLPEHSVNTAFNWKMYKEDGTETKNVAEADYIETDFLSKEKETETGSNLIGAFDPETMDMPLYKDLKIAFKVTEPNTSDRIIINQAQISDDSDEDGNPVDDVDSTPDEWNEGEDDQDIEKIKVKYFDLSLKKWVTESIVTVDGKTTVKKSGHTGNENPEPPMKVEIQAGKINTTTVKFRYNIKVTNEGEIAGYATELIDYIPEGLKFVAADNPKWKEEDGKVTTDQLKDTLLEPGDSVTVDIVLTWINGKNNMGEKVNWAEINKDKNEYNSPDIDSTPGNDKKGEDDEDQAPVLLSPATGNGPTYIGLTLTCMGMLTMGAISIKKFVL